MAEDLARRELIGIAVAAAAVTRLPAAQLRFFTPEEYAAVDELTEMIIPADEKSGGASAARVADYIDARLAGAYEQEERDDFRAGLKLFLPLPKARRLALLERASLNEKQPRKTEEKFFRLLKEHTIRGYYTSRIGIHEDMNYKGNVIQQGDYAGYLP